MIERNKTNVALDGLFEQFLNLISEARRVPLVDKIMVDENDLLNISRKQFRAKSKALTRYWRSRRILSTRLMPMLTV